MLCNSRQDALAQTLHAVLKMANYKDIPLLLNLLPVLTVLSPRGGYFFGLAPVLDTDTMVKSFGALTGIAAVALILTQRMKYQKRSLEYQKKDLGALPFPQCLQQQRHLRHARRLG
jgi:Mg2+/citrate symporter